MDPYNLGPGLARRLMYNQGQNVPLLPRLAGDSRQDQQYPGVTPDRYHPSGMFTNLMPSHAGDNLFTATQYHGNCPDVVQQPDETTAAACPRHHPTHDPGHFLPNQQSQIPHPNSALQSSFTRVFPDMSEQRPANDQADADGGNDYDDQEEPQASRTEGTSLAGSRKRPAEVQPHADSQATTRVRRDDIWLYGTNRWRENLCKGILKELQSDIKDIEICWKSSNGRANLDLKASICSQSEAVTACRQSEDWREQFLAETCPQIHALARYTKSSYLEIVERLFEEPNPSQAAVAPQLLLRLDSAPPPGSLFRVSGSPNTTTTSAVECPADKLHGYLNKMHTSHCNGRGGQDADLLLFKWMCVRHLCQRDQTKKSTFSHRDSWLKHICGCDPPNVWYCSDHEKFFKRKETFATHFAIYHGIRNKNEIDILLLNSLVYDGEKPRLCPWCGETFTKWTEFYLEHIATTHADDMREASVEMRRRQINRGKPETSGSGGSGGGDSSGGKDGAGGGPKGGGSSGGSSGGSNGGTPNDGASSVSGSTGSFLKVPKPQKGGRGHGNTCQNGGIQDTRMVLFDRSLPSWVPNVSWISPWLKLILDGGNVPDRAAVQKTWITASTNKLWCFVGATDPMMESALVLCRDALDTGTALFSDLGAWFNEIPDCTAEVDDDDVKSLSEDCELAANVEASNANEAPPGKVVPLRYYFAVIDFFALDDRRGHFLRKRRTFTADMSSAESDTCEELRSTDWSHLDKSFDMYGGEIHTRSPVRPGSWHIWDNKHQPDWESRMGYSAAQQRADQAKVEMSCITHGLLDLSMSTSSDSTTDSEATKATVYDSEDGKFFLQVEQRPAEADVSNSTNRVHDIVAVSYEGDDDREAAPVAVLSTIHEMEISA